VERSGGAARGNPVATDTRPVVAWIELRDVELNPHTSLPSKYKSLSKFAGASDSEISEAAAMAAVVRHWRTYLNGLQIDEASFRRDVDRLVKMRDRGAEIVRALAAGLENCFSDEGGAKVFLDTERIKPAYVWDNTVRISLCRSAVTIVFLLRTYFQSEFCCTEWAITEDLARLRVRPDKLRVPIIPVLLAKNVPLPREVGNIQFDDDPTASNVPHDLGRKASSMTNQPGQIITFYSYEGGVGRSAALANVAVLLAQQGKRVLAMDFDLEAPGLHRYFLARPNSSEVATAADGGVIDFFYALRSLFTKILPSPSPEALVVQPELEEKLREGIRSLLKPGGHTVDRCVSDPNRGLESGGAITLMPAGKFRRAHLSRRNCH
jgi:hypothetical protein